MTNSIFKGLALVTATAIGLAQRAEAKTRIACTGFSTANTFRIAVAEAAKVRAEEMGGAFIDLAASSPDSAAQKDALDRAIDMGVDGIMIIGSVGKLGRDASLENAASKKNPVVAVDTGIDHPPIFRVVPTDNLAAACIAGDYMNGQIDGGVVLIMGGSAGHRTGNAHRNGVLNAAEAAGHKVIFQICDWQDSCVFETTTNFL